MRILRETIYGMSTPCENQHNCRARGLERPGDEPEYTIWTREGPKWSKLQRPRGAALSSCARALDPKTINRLRHLRNSGRAFHLLEGKNLQIIKKNALEVVKENKIGDETRTKDSGHGGSSIMSFDPSPNAQEIPRIRKGTKPADLRESGDVCTRRISRPRAF